MTTCSGGSLRSGSPIRPNGVRITGEQMELKIMMSVVACLALGGCASDLKKAQVTVAEIAELLPGHYSNSAQVDADAKAGRDRHEAKAIDIVRLDLPLLSKHAFYVQEVSLDD